MRSRLVTLPRTVWILGLISLVNDGASDLIHPLLPLYLTWVSLAMIARPLDALLAAVLLAVKPLPAQFQLSKHQP